MRRGVLWMGQTRCTSMTSAGYSGWLGTRWGRAFPGDGDRIWLPRQSNLETASAGHGTCLEDATRLLVSKKLEGRIVAGEKRMNRLPESFAHLGMITSKVGPRSPCSLICYVTPFYC